MRPILSILTGATCGDNCWHAREEVCRCSCGGLNHGCLLEERREKPVRSSKIQGYMYSLAGVGFMEELEKEAEAANSEVWKDVTRDGYHYIWRPTDVGAPAMIKAAGKDQLANWPELKHMKDNPLIVSRLRTCYLLWKRVDPVRKVWCLEETCQKCHDKQIALMCK